MIRPSRSCGHAQNLTTACTGRGGVTQDRPLVHVAQAAAAVAMSNWFRRITAENRLGPWPTNWSTCELQSYPLKGTASLSRLTTAALGTTSECYHQRTAARRLGRLPSRVPVCVQHREGHKKLQNVRRNHAMPEMRVGVCCASAGVGRL